MMICNCSSRGGGYRACVCDGVHVGSEGASAGENRTEEEERRPRSERGDARGGRRVVCGETGKNLGET